MVALQERRKRKRIALHWPVYLYRDQGAPQLGERLECVIAIPAGAFGYSEAPIRLQCRVKVTRVEDQSENFGLGCCIEDYELLISSKPESHRALAADPHR